MVYAIQAVEDAFFVLQRVLERVLSTGDDASIFSVCNKIVEVLDPNQESVVYSTLILQERYKGCYELLNPTSNDSCKGIEPVSPIAKSSSHGQDTNNYEGNRSGKRSQEELPQLA